MPTIEVTTSAPDTVTAGQTFSLGVSVHNPSVHDVQDVSASLAFVRDPQHTIRPTASPATLQVGTVPAGRSVSRVWTVSSDSSWEGLQASWRVAVTGTNVRGVQRTGSIRFSKAVLPLTGALLSPALDHNWPIVIMGDSFSAGEGGGDYKPATRSALLRCHRSYKTYLADVLKPSQVRILACSGAVIADLYDDQVTDDGEFRATAQLDQLLALDAPPGAVVLTLGGNDAGFADIIKACVGHALLGLSDKDCRDDNSVGEQNLDDIGYRWHDLRRVYEDLWKAANNPRFVAQRGGKYVPVIVSTYPQEFPPAWLGYCKAHSAFTQPAIRYANELAAALMASSNHGAQAARNDGYEVYSTGDPIGAFLPSHTYCADVLRTWVQPLANPDPHRWNGKDPLGYLTSTVAGQQAMHPNANGYLAITDILRTWEAAQTRVEATDAVKRLVAEPASSASVSSVLGSALPAPTAGVSVVAGGSATLQQGQSATIDATGFAPNTPVLLTLHSVPVGLGTTLADSKGVVRLRSMIPTDTEPGRHRLMATGVDSSGADREVAIDLTVVRPIPVWVGLVGALAALALLIAAGLVIGSRPRRRRPHPLPAP
ncbi:GDSL-type esterase/lipase family protein [uncultured Amnibacterium sp.]|uniref:GDSL-type esterase/lipase family protein n=1 Tax=uncultured Amnibacterium sp. TaxID=1631851 RepID=UPI0035C95601